MDYVFNQQYFRELTLSGADVLSFSFHSAISEPSNLQQVNAFYQTEDTTVTRGFVVL